MFRKSKALIICLIAVIVFSFLNPIESSAATTYTLTSKFPQPYADDSQSGYLNLAIENYWSARDLCTIVWQVVPVTDVPIAVDVVVNSSSVTFRSYISSGNFWVNLWELQPSGYASLLYSGLGQTTYSRSTSWNGGTIVGASIFGHYNEFSWYGGSYVPSVTAIWSEQGTQIAKYNEILNALNSLNSSLGGKLDSLVSEVHNVFLQVDVAEDSLARIRELMVQYYPQFQDELETIVDKIDLMIEEQKETNTWLEKIFNWLEDSPEQEKEAASNQANQSSNDAQSSIEDKSVGFVDSVNGLASSMSYSGTQCAWTFPALYLPEIPGVMSRTQLISEKPIDFAYWVNQIPSDILLLVRSVLTIALIGYCFKEFYSVIEYVLTMRGGGNSE